MRNVLILILTAILLAACQSQPAVIQEPVEVTVPVEVPVTPAAWLMQPVNYPLPMWVDTSSKDADACLSPDGEGQLRAWMLDKFEREKAWRAWAQP